MSIKSIIDQLKDLAEELDRSDLSADQIAKMIELSQELYERMVIFRYKTFELGINTEEITTATTISTVEEPSMDSENEDIPTNQISLIDSIEEIKEMEQSLNDSLSSRTQVSLKEKIVEVPLEDLKAAITINQKFKFIAELFDQDADAFDKAITTINSYTSFLEADEYLENTLKPRYDWDTNSSTTKEFSELVSRRFL